MEKTRFSKVTGYLLLLIFLGSNSLRAEDTLVNGGSSPNGRYEVRIAKTDAREPSDYLYEVVDARSGKLIKQLDEGGGYAVYSGAKNTAKVVWHESGNFFALVDHGGRHSMDLYVYEIEGSKINLLKNPDFYQNVLGRIGSTEGYLISVVTPLSWEGDILKCKYAFDAYKANHQGRSPVYVTQVNLRLLHGANSASHLILDAVSQPTSTEN